MKSMPENLPDDPQLLKQMLAKMQSRMGLKEPELEPRPARQAGDPF